MNNTIDSVTHSSAPVLGVAGTQTDDAVAQINDLMVNLGQLFGKMRDLMRQYHQAQQGNAFKMQMHSYETKLGAIEKDFNASNAQALSQIISGGVQLLGGVGSCYGAAQASGAALSWLSHAGEVSRGVGSGIEGITSYAWVNPQVRGSKEDQAVSDYQHALADQLGKRSDETLEKALKFSADLREFTSMLVQAFERLGNSVKQ